MSMHQITDARAPFPTEDAAHDAAIDFVRSEGHAFRSCVAVEQPGGYFVRVVYETPIARGGRAGRKRYQAHTVEIGRIAS
jgi:hypothetical protein